MNFEVYKLFTSWGSVRTSKHVITLFLGTLTFRDTALSVRWIVTLVDTVISYVSYWTFWKKNKTTQNDTIFIFINPWHRKLTNYDVISLSVSLKYSMSICSRMFIVISLTLITYCHKGRLFCSIYIHNSTLECHL